MKISSIIDIVDGRLLNQPSISFIYSFKTNPKRVKEGDLFIAKKPSDIELAIENGAFAIILEKNHPIIDKEIAWISVNNIELSISKLLRFKLSSLNLKTYFCDKVTFNFLKIFNSSSDKTIKLISSNSIDTLLENINNIYDDNILICDDIDILKKIYPHNNININKNFGIDNLIEHSLFEISFSYEKEYFYKLRLPTIYLQQFLSVYYFLNKDLDLSKLKNINNLRPIFLDKNLNIIEYGKSDRFILCQEDMSLTYNEIEYIKNNYKYAKTIFINQDEISIDRLKSKLKGYDFNSAYISGYSYLEVIKHLSQPEEVKTLF